MKEFGSTAVAELNRVIEKQKELNALAAKNPTSATGTKARATGGPVTAGEPYIVGEIGKELFIPNTSGTIIPNNKLESSGKSSGSTVNLNLTLEGRQMPPIQGATKSSVDAFISELELAKRIAA